MPRKLSPSWLNWLCRTPGRRAGSWRENPSLVKPCFLFAWKTCGSSKPGVPQRALKTPSAPVSLSPSISRKRLNANFLGAQQRSVAARLFAQTTFP